MALLYTFKYLPFSLSIGNVAIIYKVLALELQIPGFWWVFAWVIQGIYWLHNSLNTVIVPYLEIKLPRIPSIYLIEMSPGAGIQWNVRIQLFALRVLIPCTALLL